MEGDLRLDEFYKLTKEILQIEREEKDFPSHLNILLGAYLETCRDLDDSYFKDGAIGKVTLMDEIQKECDGIEECLNLYSRANLGACIEQVGFEPLDVLTEYIDNGEVYTVGGHLQMLKIYPYSRVLPVGFFYPSDKRIHFYGRPLLKYETFPYPIYDVEEKTFKYMKVNSDEFELVHEEIKELKKFKKREMRNP